jgi:hypothetical protein
MSRVTTTRWSLVLAAMRDGTPEGAEALAVLCQRYWYPVYAFIRRQERDAEAAADLTQEFFARLLEVESLGGNPMAAIVQAAQATELKAVLDGTSVGVLLIVTGDINSTPVDPRFLDPVNGPFVRPFQQFVEGVDLYGTPTPGGPYLDTWMLRPGSPAGHTCCDDNLLGESMALSERKDVMFTRDMPAGLKANVFGMDPADKTPSGLWPSDHAGLMVRFVF